MQIQVYVLFLLTFMSSVLGAQELKKEISSEDKSLPSLTRGFLENRDSEYFNGIAYEKSLDWYSQQNSKVTLQDGIIATFSGSSVIALDKNLNVIWQAPTKGAPVVLGRYGDKLVAITAPDGQQKYTNVLTSKRDAYLIDAQTGKILLQKTVHAGGGKFVEQVLVYTSDNGDFLKMGVRVTERKLSPGLTPLTKLINQFSQTQEFTLFDLDENLEKKNVTPLKFPLGGFGASEANAKGEIFVRTIVDETAITVSQFVSGKTEAIKEMKQVLNARSKKLSTRFWVGRTNPSCVYIATLYDGAEGTTLKLSALDFLSGNQKEHTEVMDQRTLTKLEGDYIAVNKQLSKPDLGNINLMGLIDLEECGDQLFLSMCAINREFTQHQTYEKVYGLLLKGFDLSLKPISENIVPRTHLSPNSYGASLYREGAALHLLVNDKTGYSANTAIYGRMNTATGQIEKLVYLPKDKVDKATVLNIKNIFWSKDGFYLSYFQGGKSKGFNRQLYSFNP